MEKTKEIDGQLIDWRNKTLQSIPERVGLAFYTKDNGDVEIEVYMADENMWMSQQIMADLFGVEENTINYHIKEIYKSGELDDNDSTTRKIRVVRTEGTRAVKRDIQFYNLDVAISVGYRVNSIKATQFRKFATRILHEYIQKGYVLNDIRFKQGNKFDDAYFEEMKQQSFVLAFEEGKVAGFMSFRENYENDHLPKGENLYASTCVVHPDFRGRGMMRGFYEAMIAAFPTRPIYTRTWHENIGHLKVLERLGFVLLETLENDRGPGIHIVYFGRQPK